ncbi:hypothetical protein GLA29479_479 [Lysobacter antibioticus]|nr:hypothetical protein GLA29479_479 [Lysobacter antibioticus]
MTQLYLLGDAAPKRGAVSCDSALSGGDHRDPLIEIDAVATSEPIRPYSTAASARIAPQAAQ